MSHPAHEIEPTPLRDAPRPLSTAPQPRFTPSTVTASLVPAAPQPSWQEQDEDAIWWPAGVEPRPIFAGPAPQVSQSGNLTRSAMVAATVAAVATSTLLGPGLGVAAPMASASPAPNPTAPTTASTEPTQPAAAPAAATGVGGGNDIDYVVQAGDTLYKIAGKYGVSTSSVIGANSFANPNLILPGEHVTIPSDGGSGGGSGAADVTITVAGGNTVNLLALHYGVSAASIISANNLANPNLIIVGQKLVIPGGSSGSADSSDSSDATASLQSATAPAPVTTDVSTTQAPAPTPPPPPPPAVQATQGFVWPVKGTITQNFGPTGLSLEPSYEGYAHFHQGLDIANSMYTPISAADNGTVIFSGWSNSGYGFCVQIDHGNGLVTLYGHMAQQPSVSVGETVTAGEAIGKMGSTGASTGPHTHFAVQKNGVWVNPRNYLP
jgi:murein DD-endopeptidase MepM/ murein hydrolase activator NlpD